MRLGGIALVFVLVAAACDDDGQTGGESQGVAGMGAADAVASCKRYYTSTPMTTCASGDPSAQIEACRVGLPLFDAECLPLLGALWDCIGALRPDQYECDGGAPKFDAQACAIEVDAFMLSPCGGQP